MNEYAAILGRLENSRFRGSFHLDHTEKEYVNRKRKEVIQQHAVDFVQTRLRSRPEHDGRQTPYKGHPVFIAQHATAMCCRKCLEKWHRIPRTRAMNMGEVEYCVSVLMIWIDKEMSYD